MIPTDNYRNLWFNEENSEKLEIENIKLQLAKNNKIKKLNEKNTFIVKDFIDSFIFLNNREPMENEIFDNLKDKMDDKTIKQIIENGSSLNVKKTKSDYNV